VSVCLWAKAHYSGLLLTRHLKVTAMNTSENLCQ
jgi:hypothetical protein